MTVSGHLRFAATFAHQISSFFTHFMGVEGNFGSGRKEKTHSNIVDYSYLVDCIKMNE
jgi:hypothetical protein